MTEASENPQRAPENPVLTHALDPFGLQSLSKLAGWSKFVGIINILLGILYSLSIIVFMIPTAVVGIFMIFIGTRLLNAAGHLRFAISQKDDRSFALALDQIRSYMTLTGILYIIGLILMIIIIIAVLFFGAALYEFFSRSGFDYTI